MYGQPQNIIFTRSITKLRGLNCCHWVHPKLDLGYTKRIVREGPNGYLTFTIDPRQDTGRKVRRDVKGWFYVCILYLTVHQVQSKHMYVNLFNLGPAGQVRSLPMYTGGSNHLAGGGGEGVDSPKPSLPTASKNLLLGNIQPLILPKASVIHSLAQQMTKTQWLRSQFPFPR